MINRESIDKFSQLVSKDSIRANDFNLNIPRYVDSSEATPNWDLHATMLGGIPNSEIAELQHYWQTFPALRNKLFTAKSVAYSELAIDKQVVNVTMAQHPQVLAFIDAYNQAFNGFDRYLNTQLIENWQSVKRNQCESALSAELFNRLASNNLIDKYQAYQFLSDQWQIISADLEMMQTEGFSATKQVDANMVIKKKNGQDTDVQDDWKGHILPFDLVQKTYLNEALQVLAEKETRLADYLKKAGLIDNAKRGIWQISELGLKFLQSKPTRLTNEELMHIPEFVSFKQSSSATPTQTKPINVESENTPTELMDSSYQEIRGSLVTDLLSSIKTCSPAFFERLVLDVMLALGYGGSRRDAGEATRIAKDGGIDGIIREDKLGLDMIYLQAKKWEGTVGRPEIQKFAGALQGVKARKGVFITTSNFSNEAIDYVTHLESKIILINGSQLAELMIDHNVGVSTKQTYEVKQIDSDYFEEV